MKVKIISAGAPVAMQPLTCNRDLQQIPVAGIALEERLLRMFESDNRNGNKLLEIRADLCPSAKLLSTIMEAQENLLLKSPDGVEMMRLTVNANSAYQEIQLDDASIIIRYPWDILAINEQIVAAISEDNIKGTVRERVSVDGKLHLGEKSVILPGVFIEGNVIIGENCKIGPNCYIRGNTYIGDNCHVGQAVEIKNSLLMNNVSAGHLSYIGDSIICSFSNLGAGTISSNLRHDGKNHRSMAGDALLDTGRRKLGVIIGEHVHTGINTSFYPARKVWPGVMTKPGEIVSRDKTA
ncbi:MAG: DapH/DapD/GlmU-related protein [Victivallaceae bacterium]